MTTIQVEITHEFASDAVHVLCIKINKSNAEGSAFGTTTSFFMNQIGVHLVNVITANEQPLKMVKNFHFKPFSRLPIIIDEFFEQYKYIISKGSFTDFESQVKIYKC